MVYKSENHFSDKWEDDMPDSVGRESVEIRNKLWLGQDVTWDSNKCHNPLALLQLYKERIRVHFINGIIMRSGTGGGGWDEDDKLIIITLHEWIRISLHAKKDLYTIGNHTFLLLLLNVCSVYGLDTVVVNEDELRESVSE